MNKGINNETIIVDQGSGYFKVGLSGQDKPESVFPTLIGKPKYRDYLNDQSDDVYIGNVAWEKRGILSFESPFKDGNIQSWDDFEKIYNFAFTNELKIDTSEYPILVANSPNDKRVNKEKITEIMFESFNTPSFYLGNQSVLSLYSTGRITGVVFDCGNENSNLVPCHEGYFLPDYFEKCFISGRNLTDYMKQLLQKSQTPQVFRKISDLNLFSKIKETTCFVAKNFENEPEQKTTFELPNEEVVSLSKECYECPEIFFKSDLFGLKFNGVQSILYQTVSKLVKNISVQTFASNIVLAGGSTMFKGFEDRLLNELNILNDNSNHNLKLRVIATKQRNHSAWIGGSILASLATFPQMLISRDEYMDSGPSVVMRKCY